MQKVRLFSFHIDDVATGRYLVFAKIVDYQYTNDSEMLDFYFVHGEEEDVYITPDSKTLWLKVMRNNPYMCFGLCYTNCNTKLITTRSKSQIIEEYNKFKRDLDKWNSEFCGLQLPESLQQFKHMNFSNEKDAIRKCYIEPEELIGILKRAILQQIYMDKLTLSLKINEN